MRTTVILVLFGMLSSLTSCAEHEIRRPEPAPAGADALRVVTYNVNYGLRGDLEGIELIAESDADIVLLQETTPAWEAAIREELSDRYPTMEFRHCCGAGGLAILSTYPIRDDDYLEAPPGGWFPGWRVTLETPGGPVQTLNVHLRPPFARSGGVAVGYFTTPAKRLMSPKKLVSRTPRYLA